VLLTFLKGLFTNVVEVTISPSTVELRCGDQFVSLPARLHVQTGSQPPKVVGIGDQVQGGTTSQPIELFAVGHRVVPGWSHEKLLEVFFRGALAMVGRSGHSVVRPCVRVHGVATVAGALGAQPEAVVKSAFLAIRAVACEVAD